MFNYKVFHGEMSISPFISYLCKDRGQPADHLSILRRQTHLLVRLSESRVNLISVTWLPLPTGETHLASVPPQLQPRHKCQKKKVSGNPS